MHVYRYRTADKGSSKLIEFLEVDAPDFFADLVSALGSLNPRAGVVECPDMSDEYSMQVETRVGTFTYHKDAWGTTFVFANSPRDDLDAVDATLRADHRFVRREIPQEPQDS